MKTQEQIVEKFKELVKSGEDFFGVMRNDLIVYLDFVYAKEFLKDEITEEEWNNDKKSYCDESVIKEIAEYMPFAWDKANNCRGLSAGRNMDHMYAWCWLLGLDELAESTKGYDLYGKPQLKAICEHFNLDWKQWHNGYAGNDEYSQVQNQF